VREVEVSRFVDAPPAVVERALSPVALLEAEGSFDVRGVEDTDTGTRVRVGGYGLELVFAFTDRPDAVEYALVAGPLERLETTVAWLPENEGTRLTARSAVAVGGPAVLDRLAAWKRRGELRRALAAIAGAC
jgi:hypothetical protein